MAEILLTITALLNAVLLTSFVLEHFLQLTYDITIPVGVVGVALSILYILVRGAMPKPQAVDVWVTALIALVFATAFRGGDQAELAVKTVLGAIIPYYMGRLVGDSARAVKVWMSATLFLGLIFTASLAPLLLTGSAFRVGLGDANQIASGEVLVLAGSLTGALGTVLFVRAPVARLASGFGKGLTLVILAVVVIVVGARGASAALVSALLIGYLIRQERLSIKMALSLGVLACLGLAISLAAEYELFPGAERFSISYLLRDPSFLGYQAATGYSIGRLDLWRTAIGAFLESPVIGAGIPVQAAHNIFLEAAANYGVVGLAVLGGTLGSVLLLRPITWAKRSASLAVVLTAALCLFFYRQSSFSLTGNKSLFFVAGVLVTMVVRLNLPVRMVNEHENRPSH